MNCVLETKPLQEVEGDWLIVPISTNSDDSAPAKTLDEALGGRIAKLRETGDLTGKACELLALPDVSGIAARRVLFVGIGKPESLDRGGLEKALLTAARKVSEKKGVRAAVALSAVDGGNITPQQFAETAAIAMTVGCVGQDLYKAEPGHYSFESVSVVSSSDGDAAELKVAVERGGLLGEAINTARELINRTADDIYPETFAAKAKKLAKECGLKYDVLDEKQLEKERMGSMLAVARGSSRPPRLVVLEHRGGGDKAPTLGLVGKGVTFDSGGLSLKSNDNMSTMKCDMSGAATVLGAMTAIARLDLPVNVRGYMGLVENMVSGDSYKLGDVLNARNKTTIEVLNTDAEGRLVLADVLCYAVDSGIDRLIDLATLTGSCVVALGEDITGLFTNDQAWCDRVKESAAASGELVWQLPMFDFFADLLKSDVADVKNVGTRWGGSITAAKFLEKFVDGRSWVHMDIAGPAFASGNKPEREGGASGCMVRTLVDVAESFQ